jgi:hypothetical protein
MGAVQAFCLLVGGGGAVVELIGKHQMEWDRRIEVSSKEDNNDDDEDDDDDGGEGMVRNEAE